MRIVLFQMFLWQRQYHITNRLTQQIEYPSFILHQIENIRYLSFTGVPVENDRVECFKDLYSRRYSLYIIGCTEEV